MYVIAIRNALLQFDKFIVNVLMSYERMKIFIRKIWMKIISIKSAYWDMSMNFYVRMENYVHDHFYFVLLINV